MSPPDHQVSSETNKCRYNVSHVAIGLGDKALAQQALKIALARNAMHAEARNNLAILEFHAGNADAALAHYAAAQDAAPAMYEAQYNGALMAWKAGELQRAHEQVTAALDMHPGHSQSRELLRMVNAKLVMC